MLSDVDRSTMTATCAACGPVRIVRNGKGIRCWVAFYAGRKRRYHERKAAGYVRPRDLKVRHKRQAYTYHSGDRAPACEICLVECKTVYDHDHVSLSFRGWLCSQCNSGLGMFKESITVMKQAIAYLERTSG